MEDESYTNKKSQPLQTQFTETVGKIKLLQKY